MIPHGTILAELARVKAIFQFRAISAVMGLPSSPAHLGAQPAQPGQDTGKGKAGDSHDR